MIQPEMAPDVLSVCKCGHSADAHEQHTGHCVNCPCPFHSEVDPHIWGVMELIREWKRVKREVQYDNGSG